MTIWDDLELKVSQVSYKPDWQFKIIYQGLEPDFSAIQLLVTYKTIDIVSKELIQLSCYFGISEFVVEKLVLDKQLFQDFIWYCVTDMELHERDEWLKINGRNVREPHPELNNRVSRLEVA